MVDELLKMLALLMVVEGILPFLSPEKWRDWMQQVTRAPSLSLRIMGLASMVLGAGLLYVIR
jgi:uncharacterized protein YjeT (DUF2065 family)